MTRAPGPVGRAERAVKWRKVASEEESLRVFYIDRRLAELHAEAHNLSHERYRITNRCNARLIGRLSALRRKGKGK